MKRAPVPQRHLINAGIRTVQESESVQSPVHRQPGLRRAVHQHDIAEVAGHRVHHGRGIDQLPRSTDPFVRDDQRHVVVAGGQAERGLGRIFDDEQPCHPGIGLRRRQSVRVRVIPARAPPLPNGKAHLVALPWSDLIAWVAVHEFRRQDAVPMQNQRLVKPVLNARGKFLPPAHANDRARHLSVDSRHGCRVARPDGGVGARDGECVARPIGRQAERIARSRGLCLHPWNGQNRRAGCQQHRALHCALKKPSAGCFHQASRCSDPAYR